MPFSLPPYTWDKDRELCTRCKHYREGESHHKNHGKNLVMLCAINPYRGRRGIGTCIDNRTRGPCGKEGLQFEANRPVPDVAVYTGGTEIVIPVVREELKKHLPD